MKIEYYLLPVIIKLTLALQNTSDLNLICQTSTNTTQFARGDTITICWHFINFLNQTPITQNSSTSSDINNTDNITNITTNTTPVNQPVNFIASRLAFSLEVDKYTVISANNVYEYFKNLNSSNVSIVLQGHSSHLSSPLLPFINNNYVYQVYSLVIQFDQGVIKDMIWDNGCWDTSGGGVCGGYQTPQYVDENVYYPSCPQANYGLCDPKIYISFIGTDSNNNYMDSAGKRISRFKQYSVSEMYKQAKQAVINTGSSVQSSVSS